ncbi:MAG: PopZ family protein [Xanthobacteraceae bacterium]
MTQSAKAVEPSMEEILASIRRIIADDDSTKPPGKAPEPAKPAPPRPAAVPARAPAPAARPAAAPRPAPPPAPAADAPGMNQDDIDAMLAGLDAEVEQKPAPANGSKPTTGEILDLTESMAAPAPPSAPVAPEPPASFRNVDTRVDARSDVMFKEPAPAERPAATDRALLSASTSAAVDSAFNTLAESVLVQNARTLEDLVREMLRPMLKAWLDDNLPGLVERMVRAEIERVSRGRM